MRILVGERGLIGVRICVCCVGEGMDVFVYINSHCSIGDYVYGRKLYLRFCLLKCS